MDLFCTDVLKDAVERAGLTGFAFEHLWSSETGGVYRQLVGMERAVGEAGRTLAARDERVRREMLDRMAAEGGLPAVPRARGRR